jgi:uncharacterized membrane protein YraQ (UPF0718 family)
VISWLERDKALKPLAVGEAGAACSLPQPIDCTEPFWSVVKELGAGYAKHVWMLAKPTVTIMLLASIVSATVLTLVPWQSLLSEPTPLKLGLVSLVSVFMPVPIALDVMFAAQLQQQGVAAGFVMVFAMTLGTFSIIPSIYLWREVSKRLAVFLFVFFVCVGWVAGLAF